MQKWMPAPKARCGLGSRVGSNRSGSAKTAGSRLAAPEQRGDLLARLEVDAGHVGRLLGGALEQVQRRVVAQELLDQPVATAGVVADVERRPVGRREPGVQAVAEAVDARLVPGVEQQHRGRHELVRRQPVAAVARLHEVGQQVVAGRLRALGGELLDVGRELGAGRAARPPPAAGVRSTSYIFTIACDQGRSRCRSASGTPSSSAMTSTGSGSA